MRIAVVVRSLKIGGMERVAVNLSEAFADAGDESHLIYFKDKKRAFTPKESVHFHHFNLDRIVDITLIGFFLKIVAKLLNGIFRGTYFIYSGVLFSVAFKYKLKQLENKYGKFDLIILRGHGTFELIWPIKDDRMVQMIESIFIKHGTVVNDFYIKCLYTDKNLAGVSSGVEKKIKEVLSQTSVHAKSVNVVNNPLDILSIKEKANAYKPDISEKYIVSVGRITPNKNISFLLESYKYAREQLGLQLPLVLIGDGHDMPNIKKQIQNLDLGRFVTILGLLENPYPWIKNAELFTLTSKAEGLPTVVLEALACETKIVSTKSQGGIRDIMYDELENYLVDFSVEMFAQKIIDTINEEYIWDFEKFTKKFEPASIVKRYKELYL